MNRHTATRQSEKRDTVIETPEVRPAYLAVAEGIGERVKQVRLAMQITQKELATRLALSQSYISGVERGEDKANVDLLVGLSLFFSHVSSDWLLTGRGQMESNSSGRIDTFDLDILALHVARALFYKEIQRETVHTRLTLLLAHEDYVIARLYRTYMTHMTALLAQGMSDADARSIAEHEAAMLDRHQTIEAGLNG